MREFLIACTACLLSSTAYAADAVVEEIVVDVPASYNWSGFYIGIHNGYSWTDGEYRQTVPNLATLEADNDLDGILIGAHAGAQHQFDNNLVLGVEIDVDYRDGSGSGNVTINGSPLPGLGLEAELNWTGSARLRAGYAMDRWMPYVTGGFAFADYDAQLQFPAPPPPGQPTSFSDTSVGWTAGVGAEYAYTDNLIFRAEYRYSDFGETDAASLFPTLDATYEIESHDINIGISYKF